MKKGRFNEVRILVILCQPDQGQTEVQICQEYGLREPTFYNWKSKSGGTSMSELQRLKHLLNENRHLKQLVKFP